MRILFLREGLGVQLWYYIFARYMEEVTGETHYLDISYFSNNECHNGFELNKIFPNIKLNLLKDNFDFKLFESVEEDLANVEKRNSALEKLGVKNTIFISTTERKYIVSNCNYKLKSANELFEDKCDFTQNFENICYVGWFNDKRFFDAIKSKLFEELKFKDITDKQNLEYFNLIRLTTSVAIHIRRGDFVKLGWSLTPDDYVNPIRNIRNKIIQKGEIPYFFIFTNDMDWVKGNIYNHGFEIDDTKIFIYGNMSDAKNYIDMQLMSQCKYIIANHRSSFSLCASWLNQNLIEFIRVYPISNDDKKIKQDKLLIKITNLENTISLLKNEQITLINTNKKNISSIKQENNLLIKENDLLIKENLKLQLQINSNKLENYKLNGQLKWARKEIDKLRCSKSYKLGKMITWLPHKMRDIFK